MERPHSRKKTIAEGTATVKKGEKVENSVQAGGDKKPAAEEKQEEKK